MRNKRFPKYPDDTDYTTNSSSYYDDLARKQKLIQLLAEKIWDYDERLDERLEDLENVLQDYLAQWDSRIENLDDEVSHIFVTWLNDGTLEQIINHDVLGNKADKTYVDSEIERLDQKDESLTTLKADKTYVDQLHDFTMEYKANKSNPEFKTERSQFPSLSENVLPTSSISLGAGWSGNFGNGFTHTAGNTELLVFTFDQLIENNIYKIDIAISKPDMADTNGQSDYWITLGGSDEFETYRGIVENQTWGIINTGLNKELVIRPFEDFNGTLNISMQRVLEFADPYLSFIDENGSRSQDFRPSLLGVDSLYIGRNSGRRSLNTPNEQNTGIGSDTLLYNTTGFWNTAIGNRALLSNSVGSRNIAIGRVSLTNNTTGDRNVSIGTFAMNRNTTGRNNIAIGADSLWYNTTGDSNIAVGLLALGNNRTGDRNVGVGDNALQYNRNGSQNTAIGDNAFYRVEESFGNVGVGSGAFRRLRTGERNTIIGTNAGTNQTDGSQNIFIGYASGSSATVGDRNILIGYGVEKRNPDADYELNIGGIIRSYDMTTGEIELRKLVITQLPTTAPERDGSVWNDNGTLKIV